MSNLLIFSLFLFLILFTLDRKPINILLDFIGIILSLSLFLIFFKFVDISIISYMLIIIYGSAIVILFGFIIMLYHYSKSFIPSSNIFNFTNSKNSFITFFHLNSPWAFFINSLSFIIFLFFILFFSFFFELKNSFFTFIETYNVNIIKLIYIYLFNSFESYFILTVIINILLLVMVGILFLFTSI